jgi:hypothetical protein
MDAIRPGTMRDLRAALVYEPATRRAMTERRGRALATQPVAGIEHKARVWQEPALKAVRLVRG